MKSPEYVCLPTSMLFTFRHLPFPILVSQDMTGLLIDTCNDAFFEGDDEFGTPFANLNVPAGGDQTANVVITGDSSGITFKGTDIASGAGRHTVWCFLPLLR